MRSRDLLLSGADYDWITNYATKWITGKEISWTDTRITKFTVYIGGGSDGGGGGGDLSVSWGDTPWADANGHPLPQGIMKIKSTVISICEDYLLNVMGGNGSIYGGDLYLNNYSGMRNIVDQAVTSEYNTLFPGGQLNHAYWTAFYGSLKNSLWKYSEFAKGQFSPQPYASLAFASGNTNQLWELMIQNPFWQHGRLIPLSEQLQWIPGHAHQRTVLFPTVTMVNGQVTDSGESSEPKTRITSRETEYMLYRWTYYQTERSTSRTTKWYTDKYSATTMNGVDPNQTYNGHKLSQTYYDRNDEVMKPAIGSVSSSQAMDPNSNKWMESREDRQANQSNSKNLYSNNKNELLQTPSNKRNLQTYYVHNEPVK